MLPEGQELISKSEERMAKLKMIPPETLAYGIAILTQRQKVEDSNMKNRIAAIQKDRKTLMNKYDKSIDFIKSIIFPWITAQLDVAKRLGKKTVSMGDFKIQEKNLQDKYEVEKGCEKTVLDHCKDYGIPATINFEVIGELNDLVKDMLNKEVKEGRIKITKTPNIEAMKAFLEKQENMPEEPGFTKVREIPGLNVEKNRSKIYFVLDMKKVGTQIDMLQIDSVLPETADDLQPTEQDTFEVITDEEEIESIGD